MEVVVMALWMSTTGAAVKEKPIEQYRFDSVAECEQAKPRVHAIESRKAIDNAAQQGAGLKIMVIESSCPQPKG